MTRVYADFAYGPGPRQGCWWDETIAAPDWPILNDSLTVDVAIIGAGFTGLSAALHLGRRGVRSVVLEAETPGFGASGRNGGFCCLGGAMTSNFALTRRFGATAAAEYWQAERDAVSLVAQLLKDHDIAADTHSHGETQLAHRPKDMEKLRREAAEFDGESGRVPHLIEQADLASHGLNGPFFGALTRPEGFALNPRKYLFGLAKASQNLGSVAYQGSRVTKISSGPDGFRLGTASGQVIAKQVIIASNGYSSDTIPPWLRARYMPAQSNVLVTRPLSPQELATQGWNSDQMAYDTRGLLHYFRLMPDRRFLFGMRGGLQSSPHAEAHARQRTRRDFETMFPAWRHVDSPHSWSGMVCLSRNRTPFAGAVPGQTGMFAGLAYHGNGIAMGTYVGRLLAGLAMGENQAPKVLQEPPGKFPLGRARRLLMPPFYLFRALADL